MRYANWEVASAAGEAPAELGALVAKVLAARGIVGAGEAREFLRADVGLLREPDGLKDMDKAVARLERAMERGETIAVYGDYDVDGVTATCLLFDFFCRRGAKALWYIPRRLEDGYGLNCRGLDALKAQGAQVVVTVDCGITAVDEVEYAKSLGMEVIVTDHHACKDDLPAAVAVVDPHRPDCPYPFKGLAGVGVALKLAMALGARLDDYADLAALGTVADVMPVLDENRAIIHRGLELMNTTPRLGVQALLESAGAAAPVTAVTLGYTLAPRLNAAGRLGVTEISVELLLSRDPDQAQALARELCDLNRRRQALEGDIFQDCIDRVDREVGDDPAIVLAGEGWHQGVVGIVASRLAERFHKPTFMISLSGGMGKGSCRSAGGISLFQGLESVAELLEGYGGHAMAAGFTVKEENIPALRARLNAWVEENRKEGDAESALRVDVALPNAELLTVEEVAALDVLEPYGAGNPKPVFTLPRTTLIDMERVGAEGKHMRLRFRSKSQRLAAIFFSCPKEDWDFAPEDRVDVAFTPQINEFRGRRTVQLVVQDVRQTAGRGERDREVYQKYRQGETLSAAEAQSLIPSREEFEALWRQLRAQAPFTLEPVGQMPRWAVQLTRRPGCLARTMVGLEVFSERGLIDLENGSGRVSVTLRPRGPKVDLEQSPILMELRALAGEGGL